MLQKKKKLLKTDTAAGKSDKTDMDEELGQANSFSAREYKAAYRHNDKEGAAKIKFRRRGINRNRLSEPERSRSTTKIRLFLNPHGGGT